MRAKSGLDNFHDYTFHTVFGLLGYLVVGQSDHVRYSLVQRIAICWKCNAWVTYREWSGCESMHMVCTCAYRENNCRFSFESREARFTWLKSAHPPQSLLQHSAITLSLWHIPISSNNSSITLQQDMQEGKVPRCPPLCKANVSCCALRQWASIGGCYSKLWPKTSEGEMSGEIEVFLVQKMSWVMIYWFCGNCFVLIWNPTIAAIAVSGSFPSELVFLIDFQELPWWSHGCWSWESLCGAGCIPWSVPWRDTKGTSLLGSEVAPGQGRWPRCLSKENRHKVIKQTQAKWLRSHWGP